MILPTIIGVSEAAHARGAWLSYYEGALAHRRDGMSARCSSAVLPAAKSGVLAGVVLGVGRAIGETMAVIMVAGNQPRHDRTAFPQGRPHDDREYRHGDGLRDAACTARR